MGYWDMPAQLVYRIPLSLFKASWSQFTHHQSQKTQLQNIFITYFNTSSSQVSWYLLGNENADGHQGFFFFFFFEEWTPAFIVPVFIIILSNSSAKLLVEYKYIYIFIPFKFGYFIEKVKNTKNVVNYNWFHIKYDKVFVFFLVHPKVDVKISDFCKLIKCFGS